MAKPEDIQVVEARRSRWRRVRGALGLDPEHPNAIALSQRVPDLRVALLILPADPDQAIVNFSEEFRNWWCAPRPHPFDSSMSDWGNYYRPVSYAAIRYRDVVPGDRWQAHEYLALHRSAALEFATGRAAVLPVGRDKIAFRLIYVVARLWSMLALYGEVLSRYSVKGPWELSAGFWNTAGSRLGHLGTGWMEPVEAWSLPDFQPCIETNVLIRREIDEWPGAEGTKDLALEVADSIENTWGSHQQRYRALQGKMMGEFDSSRYR